MKSRQDAPFFQALLARPTQLNAKKSKACSYWENSIMSTFVVQFSSQMIFYFDFQLPFLSDMLYWQKGFVRIFKWVEIGLGFSLPEQGQDSISETRFVSDWYIVRWGWKYNTLEIAPWYWDYKCPPTPILYGSLIVWVSSEKIIKSSFHHYANVGTAFPSQVAAVWTTLWHIILQVDDK